ncbi:MAG: DUF951 domain-containing protein [Clostridiales bacterium]|nr:DUF951 domain-containing protein [Clostridiales bacterium]
MPEILHIMVGDVLEMKKNHPCSPKSVRFRVLRVGSDIRMVCENCGRDITVPRLKLEKNVKKIIREDENLQK